MQRQQGHKKRKKDADDHAGAGKKPRSATAIFVSNLPLDAQVEEIATTFSRYGVLLEDGEGNPRIKMYHDEKTGMFKGEALVVFFKPESVELAIQLLDDTYLRAASGVLEGPRMRVEKAEFKPEEAQKSDARPKPRTDAGKRDLQRRMDKMKK